ncbi:hypothetical protein [Ectobacillus ponti]|uniref:XRE family transcriptional regulator n=1 Tax=Ectobacillus ponti TaxID=2961894 RepID=A0AA41X6Q5_9BACI|nr:hypothetical protein [Ectobacillus ponti]MCP8969951.1 hypothetical protein [Ectobacillus ponti]
MLKQELLQELEEYVQSQSLFAPELQRVMEAPASELDDFIERRRKPSLRQMLFHFIDQAGMSDPEVYKKAGMDRKLFSKIRSNPDYRPKKNTILALAFALELDQSDTEDLLNTAGYSLSDSETFDLVIQFCLERQIYDLHDVNAALDHFRLEPLLH